MGIGDWGLGIGDWPNPQSPIPNPHIFYESKSFQTLQYKLNKNNNFKTNNIFIIIMEFEII